MTQRRTSHKTHEKRLEQEMRRETIAGLYLKGWTIRRICKELSHGQHTVIKDLREIHKRLIESSKSKLEERKAIELAKIDGVEAKAWEQYLRSCDDAYKLVEESGDGDKGKTKKTRKEVVCQSGDPRYLSIINQCIERRCKILGLDAPDRFEDVTPMPIIEVLVNSHEEHVSVRELLDAQRSLAN